MKLWIKKILATCALAILPMSFAHANSNINSILFIGDSHSVRTFGNHIFSHLQLINPERSEVHSYASCGSSPHQWLNSWNTHCGYKERHFTPWTTDQLPPFYEERHTTPLLSDLLQHHRPQLVVVEIGGNATGLTQAGLNSSVRRFLNLITQSGAKCIWAGPPEAMNNGVRPIPANRIGVGLDVFYARLRVALGRRCTLYDSRPITPPLLSRGGDGIHFVGTWPKIGRKIFFNLLIPKSIINA